MIAGLCILAVLAVLSVPAQRALGRWLDRLEGDVESDEHWRPL